MKLQALTKYPDLHKWDVVVYCITNQKDKWGGIPDNEVGESILFALQSGDYKAKEGQSQLFYSLGSKGKSGSRGLAVGLGKKEPERELFRGTGGSIAKSISKTKAANIAIILPKLGFSEREMAECLTEGIVLGNYSFTRYQEPSEDETKIEISKLAIYGGDNRNIKAGMKSGLIAAESGIAARNMANEPGNFWTPQHFVKEAEKLAKEYNLKISILKKKEIQKQKMGGILGVNQGSAKPPTVSILEYRTGKKVPTLLLVGKGLTFDTGGISLKPGAGMEEMKYDMCGGAAVLATIKAIAQEKPKHIDVIGIVPATENMPGSNAIKPGDVVTAFGGKTIEVINTDAEGRLILADALSYGIKKYKPDMVLDVATLTGAVIISLGHHHTGLLSNDDSFADKVINAGERAGEPAWRLPLGKEYTKQLKSDIADIRNLGKTRDGGTITAAAFLEEFVGNTPWVHLDIAGTAWNFTEKSYIPKGPSGIPTRTLLELVRNWKKL